MKSDPAWTPDGKHIAFSSQGSGTNRIQWIRSDGAGEEHTLLEKNAGEPTVFLADSGRIPEGILKSAGQEEILERLASAYTRRR